MNPKYIIFSLVLIIVALSCFYAGAEWGVQQWIYLDSPVEAMYRVAALNRLQHENKTTVMQMEEMQLSLDIQSHAMNCPGWRRFFWTRDMRELSQELPKASKMIGDYARNTPLNLEAFPPNQRKIISEVSLDLMGACKE
jgi:hypothetical protein